MTIGFICGTKEQNAEKRVCAGTERMESMSEIKRDETLYRESYVLALQKENAELKEQIALFVGFETAAMEQGEKSLCVQLSEANAAQAKRIAELENDLVEWNEFKKTRDMQMKALRKQMS